jgi:hypothetical protein
LGGVAVELLPLVFRRWRFLLEALVDDAGFFAAASGFGFCGS